MGNSPAALAAVARHYADLPEYGELAALLSELADIAERQGDPQTLDDRGVATLLGVPLTWVREQKRRGRIPYRQLRKGGRVTYDRDEILEWWKSLGHRPNGRGRR